MRVIPDKPTGLQQRARVADIAKAAKVSTATVDRVLNHRPGVRDATAQKVLKAAAELDYLPDTALYAALAAQPMRLTFLLPDGSNRFIRMLGDTVGYSQDHLSPFNVKCRTELFESFNPQQLAASLLRLGQRNDGIAFMALEHPAVREAVSALADKGVPTITLISDLSGSNRAGYVGLDNRAAGRTAGYLVGRFLGPGARAAKKNAKPVFCTSLRRCSRRCRWWVCAKGKTMRRKITSKHEHCWSSTQTWPAFTTLAAPQTVLLARSKNAGGSTRWCSSATA